METTSRHTLVIMLGTVISRLMGFARDAAMAWLLGGTPLADAMSVALRLPYFVRRLLGEGTLSMALTSLCVQHGSVELVRRVMRQLTVLVLCAIALGMVWALPLTTLLAPGLHGLSQSEAVGLVRWCLPYVGFAVLAAGSMAVLHSREHFGWSSLSPVLFNALVLAGAMGCIVWSVSPVQAAYVLASSVVAGGLAQWLLQWAAQWRSARGRVFVQPVDERCLTGTPAEQATQGRTSSHWALRVLAGILGAAMPQLAFLLAGLLSSFLPAGHMAALFYAERLLEFPLGVIGAAVGMASAPQLARQAACHSALPHAGEGQASAFTRTLESALALTVACNLPAAAGLVAVSTPLVALVLGHGAFDARATEMTALALCAYAPALPAYAASRPLLGACHALGAHRVPLLALLPGLATTVCVGWLGLGVSPLGPPVGVSAGLWVNVLCLWLALAQRGVRVRLSGRHVTGQVVSGLLVWGVASRVVAWAAPWPPVAVLALAVPAGVLAYGLGLAATGNLQFLRTCLTACKWKKLSSE